MTQDTSDTLSVDTATVGRSGVREPGGQTLPVRLRQLGAMLDDILSGRRVGDEQFELLRGLQWVIAHSASQGIANLGAQAKALEERLRELLPLREVANSELREELLQRMALLYSQPSSHDLSTLQARSSLMRRIRPSGKEGETQTIILMADDPYTAKALALQLDAYGYRTVLPGARDSLAGILEEKGGACVVIFDMSPDAALTSVTGPLSELRDSAWRDVPSIVLAPHPDFLTRLHLVRASVVGLLPKPVDISELVECIERYDRRPQAAPERVLIVDDDRAVGNLYRAALRKQGILAECVSEAGAVESALADFNPELVLLDLYMPNWNGMELAAAIRLHPAYFSLPIVFLSAEEDVSRQLAAMRHGGDEFLTKPIDLNHLVGLVRARVARYRQLRSLMLQDSLTGVLNHAAVVSQLGVLLSRAVRTGQPLSVVMLDLDRFKHVNDHYGHPVGDRVLKSLTFMLKQRLRASDVVGRFGGEEFVLLMPDTDTVQAEQVVDALRQAFSKLDQRAADSVFQVSFSAGVAGINNHPTQATANDLIAAADQALYQAKESGRNRVVVYRGGSIDISPRPSAAGASEA